MSETVARQFLRVREVVRGSLWDFDVVRDAAREHELYELLEWAKGRAPGTMGRIADNGVAVELDSGEITTLLKLNERRGEIVGERTNPRAADAAGIGRQPLRTNGQRPVPGTPGYSPRLTPGTLQVTLRVYVD